MMIDPVSYNRPERPTLGDDQVGDVGQAVLTLTRELWIVIDRMRILEAVLAKHGIDAHEEVNAFQPDLRLEAELAEEGKRLAANVVAALSGDQAS